LVRESGSAGRGAGLLEKLVAASLQHGASTREIFYSRGGTATSGTDGLAFSRTPAAGSTGADPGPRATLAKYTKIATDKLNEVYSHPGKISLWDMAVGKST
jgi:hypothetical protein